jgi:hypothetical protein
MEQPQFLSRNTARIALESHTKLVQWPHDTRSLGDSRSRLVEFLLNAIAIMLVSVLFVFTGLLLVSDGAEFNEGVGYFLRQLSQLVCAIQSPAKSPPAKLLTDSQGPTIVPLMFTFTVGRSVRSFAQWRLQQGERIGLLDLLFGSTSVTGTVSTLLELRRFGLVELFLLLIWVFSPFGGQAILRVFSIDSVQDVTTAMFQYMDVSGSSFPDDLISSVYGGRSIPINTLFLASLGAPDATKKSPQDTWGNIKVPLIEQLPGMLGAQKATDGWIDISNMNATEIPYSSLTGIPVANIPRDTNATFNIETSYWHLDCPVLRNIPEVDIASFQKALVGQSNTTCQPAGCGTLFLWGSLSALPSQQGRTGISRCAHINETEMDARWIQYFSFDPEDGGTFANCSMRTSYVELGVTCEPGFVCHTKKIRPSVRLHRSVNITGLDYCPGAGNASYPILFQYFISLFASFTKLPGAQNSGSPSALQVYLTDPAHALNASLIANIPPVHTIGSQLFATRFGQLLNTYWLSTVGTEALFLGHTSSFNSLSAQSSTISRAEVNGWVSSPRTIIVCNRPWLIPLFVCTTLMLLATVAQIVTDWRILVPKVMMNMSTVSRGNLYFGLPPGGGGLSDRERSNLIGRVRVRLGESHQYTSEPQLVIGDCEEDGGRVAPFRTNWAYS